MKRNEIGVCPDGAQGGCHYAQVMSTVIGLDGSQILEVEICDSRDFDRCALAEALSHDSRLLVNVVTGDPELVLDALVLAEGTVAVLAGSRVLRESPDLARRIRSVHPGTRVFAIGVDESSLQRLVDTCDLDGFVRRDGEIDSISRTLRGVDGSD